MNPDGQETKIKFNIEDAKEEINQLLAKYRVRKDELEWANDDWEESEIQEELDGYAKKIKLLKAQIKEYEQMLKV